MGFYFVFFIILLFHTQHFGCFDGLPSCVSLIYSAGLYMNINTHFMSIESIQFSLIALHIPLHLIFNLIDKTEPNYIDTVIGVFMEQAEGISVEELQYRMLMKSDSADDYNAHLHKMKIKLLDWQTKQSKP